MDKLQVLIVDDSIVYRKILSAAVEATGFATAAQTASNGLIALERIQYQTFDVVLLDVNMPEMDGIQTLKRIKSGHPHLAVIMISSSGEQNAAITLKTLEAGAMDFIIKPLEENYDRNLKIVSDYLKVLFAQIRIKSFENHQAFGKILPLQPEKEEKLYPVPATTPKLKSRITGIDLVVIASSTGGPVALEEVFSRLEKGFSKPMLVVQHMPPDFTKVLAQNLDRKSTVKIIEGKDGDVVRAGQAILAPGGYHMTLQSGAYSNRMVKLNQSELVNGVRPSADVLFQSVGHEYQGSRILAVILTGMGNDGMAGVAALKRTCNCYCITQSEETCVVYGMPRSVAESGLSDESVAIGGIARRIQEIANNGS